MKPAQGDLQARVTELEREIALLRAGRDSEKILEPQHHYASTVLSHTPDFAYVPTLQGLEIPGDMPDSKIAPAAFDLAANLDYSEIVKYSDASLERWNKEVVG